MSVGFGFSAGDFIAALTLVSTVVDALRDSGDSSSDYRELISQLYSLETALLSVKRIELDDFQHAEHVALMQAAAQCQKTIDTFWEKIKKYQSSLRAGGTGSKVRDGWRKIRWALCRKEDLAKFKADLMGHTESIEMLLTTVQMAATRIDSKKNDEQHRTMAGKMQESYFGCMQRINLVFERVSTGIQQGKQLLEMTAKVFQTNVQIFQIVVRIQDIITRIPGQVERQQPVYFIDALGRHSPFHLEFILSAEALISVLRSNFKNIGPGARKIEDGEFVIQDSSSKIDIDLTKPWETCFRPGQHADMSMIFSTSGSWDIACPKCRVINGDDFARDEDIECRLCKLVYRRSIMSAPGSDLPRESSPRAKDIGPLPQSSGHARVQKRKMGHEEREEMALFRRVRIKTALKPDNQPVEESHVMQKEKGVHSEIGRKWTRHGATGGVTSNFRMESSPPAFNSPTYAQLPDDPYADPELYRMLLEEQYIQSQPNETLDVVDADMRFEMDAVEEERILDEEARMLEETGEISEKGAITWQDEERELAEAHAAEEGFQHTAEEDFQQYEMDALTFRDARAINDSRLSYERPPSDDEMSSRSGTNEDEDNSDSDSESEDEETRFNRGL